MSMTQNNQPIVLGIDLGTTYSAMAYVDQDDHLHVIKNADGKTTTPSVVMIDNGQTTVGEVALNQWITNEEHVIRWIKRAIGSPDFRFQALSAVEVSAEILRALKRDAELFLGAPVTEAFITCPAYFNGVEIENTKKAGELAGFHVREIVKEPTAAAIYYGIEFMRDGETILVCDLGGGTFDATVLTLNGETFTPVATDGNRKLGGHDWTMELVNLIVERCKDQFGVNPELDLIAGQKLYEACEQAKRDFHRLTKVVIPCDVEGRVEQFEVTRDEFEDCTEGKMAIVVMWCEQALQKAGLTWRDIDRILLVGGSSRLRRLAASLQEASGKTPVAVRNPDLAVAYGAAIMAHGGVVIIDSITKAPKVKKVEYEGLVSRSLGTRAITFDDGPPRIITAELIPQGSKTPVSRTRDDFAIANDGQTYFDIPVVEFDNEKPIEINHSYRCRCPSDAKKDDPISVTFHYDKSGIPMVTAVARKTGEILPVESITYEEPDLEVAIRVRIRPQWVVFAIDVSGSMFGEKIAAAKVALLEQAKKLLAQGGGDCRVGVVSFATEAKPVCSPTTNYLDLEDPVNKMEASGTTSMDDGISLAIGQLINTPADVDRVVVMLTDGMPDSHRRDATLQMARQADNRGVKLTILGLGSDQEIDRGFLDQLSPFTFTIESHTGIGTGFDTLLKMSSGTAAAAGANSASDAPIRGITVRGN